MPVSAEVKRRVLARVQELQREEGIIPFPAVTRATDCSDVGGVHLSDDSLKWRGRRPRAQVAEEESR